MITLFYLSKIKTTQMKLQNKKNRWLNTLVLHLLMMLKLILDHHSILFLNKINQKRNKILLLQILLNNNLIKNQDGNKISIDHWKWMIKKSKVSLLWLNNQAINKRDMNNQKFILTLMIKKLLRKSLLITNN